MEYDNDRLRRPPNRIELFYWVLFILINPVVNFLTLFLTDWKIGPVLLLVNFALFPAYLLYARIMGSVFLIQRRWGALALMSLLSFLFIQTILFALYSLVLKFPLSPAERSYFTYNYGTLLRESWWVITNMALSTAIFFIRKAILEKELLETVQ